MKIDRVTIKRFQSLWECDLELGDLTVVVGPSNSGKSAFGRALRTLARNAQGNSFVSHGAKSSLVTARLDSGDHVTIERGKGASAFRISNPTTSVEEIYTKSGTNVPEDVAKLLAMPLPDEGPDPHFTTQFDGPFLLNAGGSTSAKAIGELTNVSLLAEAAREANRRRQESQRTAKIRREDSQRAAQEVRSQYGNLQERKAATEKARVLLDSTKESATRAARLEALAERAATAELAASRAADEVEQLTATAEALDTDLGALLDKVARAARLEETAVVANQALTTATEHEEYVEKLGKAILAAEARTHDLLKEHGECPTCRQSIPA